MLKCEEVARTLCVFDFSRCRLLGFSTLKSTFVGFWMMVPVVVSFFFSNNHPVHLALSTAAAITAGGTAPPGFSGEAAVHS